MPEFFTNFAQPQQRNSLADMVNMAAGIQNFQQAQQLQPLQLEKARMELQQLKQTQPLELQRLAAEAKVAEQTAEPRISAAGSAATEAGAKANVAKLDEFRAYLNNARRDTGYLIGKEKLTREDVIEHYKKSLENATDDAETRKRALAQATKNLPNDPNELRKHLIRDLTQAVTAESQIDRLFPAATMTSAGNMIVPTATGNAQLSMSGTPGMQVGPAIGTNLTPQVFTHPITGQPTVVGGGGPAPTPAPSFQQQFVQRQQGAQMPPAAPQNQGTPQGNAVAPRVPSGVSTQPQGGGQLAQGANESPANFNARVAQTQQQYAGALEQYNNPHTALGHIPTIQTINKNILDLLKDKDVNTGAIADYMAHKTNKGALNSKEQELTKYLEQRIQNLSPRTDRDAQSKQSAYGSFNLDKEALKEIVRNDNTWLTTQDLLAKGILNNGSNPRNPQNPNYGGVSNFTNNFARYANDPTLMRYISLVGDKQKVHLDDDDKAAFGRLVGKMSQEQRTALEQKRQEVLRLVNPGGL